MPIVLKIDPQRRIVSSTFHGRVTSEELLRHRRTIIADPHFQKNFADVVDLSAVSIMAVNDAAMGTLAAGRSAFDDGVPHIIIAPVDLPHELAVKYRDLARQSRPNLHVVRTVVEARELLESLGYQL
jgi:hypothetical protein